MARFWAAQINLRQRGLDPFLDSVPPPKGSFDNLDDAQDDYDTLASESKDDPVLGPIALLAQAKAVEASAAKDLSNLDKAVDLYKELKEKFPDSAAGKEAAERLKLLNDKSERARIEAFYEQARTGRPPLPG
jgi:hypothetical protein